MMLYQALAGFKADGKFYRRGDQIEQSEGAGWNNWKSMIASKLVEPLTPDNDLSQACKTKHVQPHVVDDRIAREVAAMKSRYEAQHAAPNMSDKQRKDLDVAAGAKRDAKAAADARAAQPKWEGKGAAPPAIIEDKAEKAIASAKAAFDAGHAKPAVAAPVAAVPVAHVKTSKR
jgi:hypothetical protein